MRRLLLPCLLAFLAACSSIPKPPAGVPEKAVWVAEGKAGYFVNVDRPKDLGWIITIYDRQGKVVTTGEYRLQGLARAELRPSDFAGCDGKIIRLTDGGLVVPKGQ